MFEWSGWMGKPTSERSGREDMTLPNPLVAPPLYRISEFAGIDRLERPNSINFTTCANWQDLFSFHLRLVLLSEFCRAQSVIIVTVHLWWRVSAAAAFLRIQDLHTVMLSYQLLYDVVASSVQTVVSTLLVLISCWIVHELEIPLCWIAVEWQIPGWINKLVNTFGRLKNKNCMADIAFAQTLSPLGRKRK